METTTLPQIEEWKEVQITGFVGLYKISNNGRVKANIRLAEGRNGLNIYSPKILKTHITNKGYHYISLNNNKVRKKISIHRLVALHFIPNPLLKLQVNHKNGDKNNNADSNLEWMTNQENRDHYQIVLGDKRKRPVLKFSLEGILLKEYKSVTSVKNDGFSATHVWECCNKKRETNGGFIWIYKNLKNELATN